MVTDLITLKCIKGEEWPLESFRAVVDTNIPFSEESVIFNCPKYHKFNLKEALSHGIFTSDQAEKIMAQAKKTCDELVTNSKIHLPSEYLPSKEVTAQNLHCDGCGKKAQRRHRNKVLCLDCMAAFDNYLEKYEENDGAWEVLYGHWGGATLLFWEKLFARYVASLPPLGKTELEELFLQCKKEVRSVHNKKRKGATG